MSSWVGRTTELERLAAFAEARRLVVVGGLAGVGKTSLVREHLAREGGPVVWATRVPNDAPENGALVLELVGETADLGSLTKRLYALLDASPDLSIFVTTTDTRWFKGPTFDVVGLATAIGALECSNAAELFLQHSPTAIERSDYPLVEQLVRWVDGHPRAILDLADRVRSMRLEELVERRSRLADLLTRETTDPLRHQIEELDPVSSAVLATAVDFSGPFALSDLECVLPEHLPSLPQATDTLAARGLLVRSGRRNAELHVPRLIAAVEAGRSKRPRELRRRLHARVEEVAREYVRAHGLTPPQVTASLRRFGPDLLRAVWDESGSPAEATRSLALLVVACDDFGQLTRERQSDWRAELDRVGPLLAEGEERRTWLRAGLGIAFAYAQTEPKLGRRFVDAVLESPSADEDLAVLASFVGARLLLHEVPPTVARARFEELEARAVARGNLFVAALTSLYVANSHARLGERREAFTRGSHALVIAERTKNLTFVAQTKLSLAELFFRLGDPKEAERLCLEIEASGELVHDPYGHAYTSLELGYASLFSGDDVKANRHFRDVLYTPHEFVGARRLAGPAMFGLAMVACRAAEWQAALEHAERALFELRSLGATTDIVHSLFAACVAARHLGRGSYVKARVVEIRALLAAAGEQRGPNELLGLLENEERTADTARATETFVRAHLRVPDSLEGAFDYNLYLSALMASFLVAPITPSREIHVLGNGEKLRIGSQTVELATFPTLRRLFWALAVTHWEDPSRSISLEELAASVWPGQKISFSAVKNRIHVSLSKLRKLGLGNAFEVSDERVRLSGLVRLTR